MTVLAKAMCTTGAITADETMGQEGQPACPNYGLVVEMPCTLVEDNTEDEVDPPTDGYFSLPQFVCGHCLFPLRVTQYTNDALTP